MSPAARMIFAFYWNLLCQNSPCDLSQIFAIFFDSVVRFAAKKADNYSTIINHEL